jgi:Na+-transporting NADH:ubiquinone oxidoreductase subunit NqrF
MAQKYLMDDGIIGPGGKTIVSGPEGTIQLNDKDSMIVGTNLGGGGNANPKSERMVEEQLQQTKTQNQLLSQLIGNTNKLKDLDTVSFYEIQ